MPFMHKKTFDIESGICSDIFEADAAILNDIKGNYFSVDDLIALPVQVLNRKSYITRACCSGHPFFRPYDSYILFEEGIHLPSLPHGFSVDDICQEKSGKLCIRHSYSYYDEGDAYKCMREFLRDNLEAMEQLYKWTLDLPDFLGGGSIGL